MAGNNAINNQAFSYNGMPLWGVNFVPLQGSLSSSPSATIYTVPTGKKAVCYQFMYRNTSGASRSIQTRYTIQGSDYDTNVIGNLSDNNSRGEGYDEQIFPGAMVMNAGESFKILGAAASSVQYFITMLEFDDNVPWYSVRNLNLNSSPVTLYTVPAGKKALIGAQTCMGTGCLWTTGTGGSSRTREVHFVNNGGSLGTDTLVYFFSGGANSYNALTSTANENSSCMAVLSSGDTVQLTQTVTTGNNWIFLNVYEVSD